MVKERKKWHVFNLLFKNYFGGWSVNFSAKVILLFTTSKGILAWKRKIEISCKFPFSGPYFLNVNLFLRYKEKLGRN